ncbi:hypothetical protein [Microbacterium trichothecenolyticum]|uniref:Lipoprotein n=1 Tax=Microbacterium trichothecenolyticum TaxID=69370 RepID=A0ABU0TRD6_MICTR|nr:hypothetical protein [Microbacterium trichothecenolyticum]MDQ1122218.1 hypothetical protein [Microbacterium trichothecenolyticum]
MNARPRLLVLPLLVAAVLSSTSGCIPLPSPLSPDAALSSSPTPTSEAGEESDVSSPPDADALGDAFVEREEFFREQQLPTDGSPLVAVTPAQKEFIAQQRAYIESQGASWSAQDENIALALAADACETAILNAHRVDASVLQSHVVSSPLFAAILPKDADAATRAAGERNVASVMVFGTSFLCPDDAPAWQSAYTEVYGG